MALNVYLIFNGNCREAVEFYEQAFQTKREVFQTFAESPQNPDYQMPEEAKALVMHAKMTVFGSDLMFSDNFPGSPFTVGNNVSIAVVSNDLDGLKSSFNKLQEGGTVEMELQETFWSKCYGSLTDKFGVHWQISHEG